MSWFQNQQYLEAEISNHQAGESLCTICRALLLYKTLSHWWLDKKIRADLLRETGCSLENHMNQGRPNLRGHVDVALFQRLQAVAPGQHST